MFMKQRNFMLCLILLLNISAFAQFSGAGTGTLQDPYEITTASQLNEIRNYLGEANASVHFELKNDINLSTFITQESPITGWNPIGNDEENNAFYGFLHGGDFTVSNLWINKPESNYLGLFGYIRGGGVGHITIKTDDTHGIAGTDYIGVLAGKIEDAAVTNSNVQVKIVGGNYVGGLVGETTSTVSFATASGTIDSFGDNIGGLIGFTSAAVSNSSANLNIKNTADVFVGNFMGGLVGTAQSTVTDCSATGTIKGTNVIGGLVGNSFGHISNSHASTEVTGNERIGGLIGVSSAITNCYATGKVTGDKEFVGGLTSQSYGNITQSYATGNVYGAKTLGGLVGMSYYDITISFASGDVTQVLPNSLPEGGLIDVGGLVGNAFGIINNCYATGNITTIENSRYVGGLVGISTLEVSNCYASGNVLTKAYSMVGGLIGDAWGPVTNCTAANPVVTSNTAGNLTNVHRLVGILEFEATVTNSFALKTMRLNGETLAITDANDQHGKDKTAAELQNEITYGADLDWNFDEVWTIREGQGYPYFGWKEYLTNIISASVNEESRGTISPIGDIAVQTNTSKSFTITPKENFEIESVIVDGENVGTDAEYTFEDIAANHTIVVNFVAKNLGIKDPTLSGINVYPNPVNNILNVVNSQNYDIEVYNLYGQKVITQTAGEELVKIDMSKLPTATYLVKITNGSLTKTIKVIKQ
ncbi:hypothetical protein AMR72_02670 [Flavobacterium psychrophilum]|nr:hypothetical protein AMR72_02670 [Flavobacterium psychrophilum]AOE51515.1 hypothetical protein ALW18_02670 [Flavobacterium psychrophilum]